MSPLCGNMLPIVYFQQTLPSNNGGDNATKLWANFQKKKLPQARLKKRKLCYGISFVQRRLPPFVFVVTFLDIRQVFFLLFFCFQNSSSSSSSRFDDTHHFIDGSSPKGEHQTPKLFFLPFLPPKIPSFSSLPPPQKGLRAGWSWRGEAGHNFLPIVLPSFSPFSSQA